MAKPQSIPDELQAMLDKPNEIVLNMSTLNRCKDAYLKITYAGWPVEKTTAAYGLSSTWFRKVSVRNYPEWEAEQKEILKQRHMLGLVGFDYDKESGSRDDAWWVFLGILFSSPLNAKVNVDDDEGICDYEDVTDADIMSLKPEFWLKWDAQKPQ